MTRFDRKVKRDKKAKALDEVKEKMGMFDKLDDECLNCQKAFDKKNRDMVSTWRVVVKREQGIVNLYCPECWDFAQKIVKEALHNE
jgi:hypothetical protein